MMLQVVASPMNVILTTTLEVSFTHPENIYSTGVTHDDLNIFIVQATRHRGYIECCTQGRLATVDFLHVCSVLMLPF
jgi:hypothetical protein